MKKHSLSIAIVFLLLACILTGCISETPVSTEDSSCDTNQATAAGPQILWEENSKVSFPEPYPYSQPNSTLSGAIAKTEGVKYHFGSGIPEDARNNTLYKIEEIIAAVKGTCGEPQKTCEVYISNDSYHARAYENQLYVGLGSLDAQDSVVGIIQMLYGYQLNYGLAYALSCDIADQLGLAYDDNEITLADALVFA